jgi:hypothetical protein
MKMRVPLILIPLLLTCCATPYQEYSPLGGGVRAEKLSANTYKIESYGNGYATPALVHDYAMLKAAETTQQAGGTHFVIARDKDAPYSTYAGGFRYTFPGKELEISVLTLSPGQPTPRGAFSASAVTKSLANRKGGS